MAAGSSMSAGTTSDSPGSVSATFCNASSSRETRATRWPASDNASAHAAPMPFEAPVTRAIPPVPALRSRVIGRSTRGVAWR